jgi:gluconate 2-dehydrogenase gamma chain
VAPARACQHLIWRPGSGRVHESPSHPMTPSDAPRGRTENPARADHASGFVTRKKRPASSGIARRLDRRRFLGASALAAVSVPALVQASLEQLDWRFLTLDEARMLGVLCDVIIPPDQHAGAEAAGTVEFIDRKLAGYHRRSQALYRQGLAALAASCEQLFQKPLAGLAADQRVALVTRWEKGDLPEEAWKDVKPREFFDRFVDHVMQGYFGGPRHGGNRDAVSWRMLGLPQPPVRSRRPESPRRTQP